MKRVGLTAILIAIFLTGCDFFAPPPPRSFALETLGGRPLPAAPISRGGPAILGDTIAVTEEGPTFRVHVAYRTWYAGTNGPELSATSDDFEPRGDSLVWIFPPCPQSDQYAVDCYFAYHALRIDGDRATITYSDTAIRVHSYREIK